MGNCNEPRKQPYVKQIDRSAQKLSLNAITFRKLNKLILQDFYLYQFQFYLDDEPINLAMWAGNRGNRIDYRFNRCVITKGKPDLKSEYLKITIPNNYDLSSIKGKIRDDELGFYFVSCVRDKQGLISVEVDMSLNGAPVIRYTLKEVVF